MPNRVLHIQRNHSRQHVARAGPEKEGLGMLLDKISGVLSQHGLEAIEAKGRDFDHYFHEAVLSEPGEKEGLVLEELVKGYLLNGKVIRHTKVKISKPKEQKV